MNNLNLAYVEANTAICRKGFIKDIPLNEIEITNNVSFKVETDRAGSVYLYSVNTLPFTNISVEVSIYFFYDTLVLGLFERYFSLKLDKLLIVHGLF